MYDAPEIVSWVRRKAGGTPAPPDPSGSCGCPASLRVVHVARRYAVLEKPAGMLSVPGKGWEKADCVASRARAMFSGATGPIVVHRLDMETSGLIVVALDEESQRYLSWEFERRRVEKAYVALVEGEVRGDAGVIDLPIRADIERRPYQVHDPVHGREAVTRWRVMSREVDRTRVRFEPVTGRTHQIRVHAAHAEGLGRAIVGDVLYGEGGAERLMLHASELAFRDPESGERVKFVSQVPF